MKIYSEKDIDYIQRCVDKEDYTVDTYTSYDDILDSNMIYVKGVKIWFRGNETYMFMKDNVKQEYMNQWKLSGVGTFLRKDMRSKTMNDDNEVPYKTLHVVIGDERYKLLVRELVELSWLSRDKIVETYETEEGNEIEVSEYQKFVNDYFDLFIGDVRYNIIKLMMEDDYTSTENKFDTYHVSEITVNNAIDKGDEDVPMCDKRPDDEEENLNINLFED